VAMNHTEEEIALQANKEFSLGQYSAAIQGFSKCIASEPNFQLYCNRAAAYFHMELYRRCIQDCNAALKLKRSCLRAYLLKGHAYTNLNKKKEAQISWKLGSSILDPDIDLELHLELKRCASGIQLSLNNPTPEKTLSSGTTNDVGKAPDIQPKQKSISVKGENAASEYDIKTASAAVAAQGLVQHGVGDTSVDEKIAWGYLHVNTGSYAKGINLFNSLLKSNPRIVGAYLGRGTAYALCGKLQQAISDFSTAIEIDPKCVDGWKRRGQSKAALGNDAEAIYDLAEASALAPNDPEVYHQRGLVLYKLKNFRRAMVDFKKAATLDPNNKLSWNHLGLCQNAIGSGDKAMKSHQQAVKIDPLFKEGWANLAQAYKDYGQIEPAEFFFTKSLTLDPDYIHSYHLRGLERFAAGNHIGALSDFIEALKRDPTHKECLQMRGIVYHGLGRFRKAIQDYNTLVNTYPDHVTWYNKEVALFCHRHLDRKISQFNIDRQMDPYLKEAWCKRLNPATLVAYTCQPQINSSIPDVSSDKSIVSEDAYTIIKESAPFAEKIQLHSPGYAKNVRQHRMAGISIIELAQALKKVWDAGGNLKVQGKGSSHNEKQHLFGWRDMYDIAIKWRQFSEPNDPVWWVDLLSPEQFAEGFGSHTPMITGQTYVTRYYPMFARAFSIMKQLIKEHPNELTPSVERATNCKELHDIIRKDFWVTTPCHSTARPGVVMEGTRLTCQFSPPEGYEYSIRTPGTPPRWKEYEYEMDFIFNELKEAITNTEEFDLDRISDLILTLTFYWYNFMPLSRGTAAVGYISLLGLFLSIGYEIDSPIKEKQQPDWEGILRPRPSDFIAELKPWMYPARKKTNILSELPSVAETLPTLRHRIQALNADI